LVVDLQMDVADGYANALEMLDNNVPGQGRITVGEDKGYDTRDFVPTNPGFSVTCQTGRLYGDRAQRTPNGVSGLAQHS
jgi:hypothetical protein